MTHKISTNFDQKALEAYNLGEDGKLIEAELLARACQQALPKDPRWIALLAHIVSLQGSYIEARYLALRALELDPNNAAAWTVIVRTISFDKLQPTDPIRERMLKLQHDPKISSRELKFLHFCLAKIAMDDLDYDKAFEHYRHANDLIRQQEGVDKPLFQEQAVYETLDSSFYKRHMRQIDDAQRKSPPPLIAITGLSRSGKSLIEKLVCTHPAITSGGELANAKLVMQEVAFLHTSELQPLIANLIEVPLPRVYSRYKAKLDESRVNKPNARFITDTSPATLGSLCFLPFIDPRIPVVLCGRDPYDLAVSMYMKAYKSGEHRYASDLSLLGEVVAKSEKVISHSIFAVPNPTISIKYEDLVTNPLKTTRKIWEFLGLEVDSYLIEKLSVTLNSAKRVSLNPAISSDSLQGFSDELVGVARHFRKHLDAFTTTYDQTKHAWLNKIPSSSSTSQKTDA